MSQTITSQQVKHHPQQVYRSAIVVEVKSASDRVYGNRQIFGADIVLSRAPGGHYKVLKDRAKPVEYETHDVCGITLHIPEAQAIALRNNIVELVAAALKQKGEDDQMPTAPSGWLSSRRKPKPGEQYLCANRSDQKDWAGLVEPLYGSDNAEFYAYAM